MKENTDKNKITKSLARTMVDLIEQALDGNIDIHTVDINAPNLQTSGIYSSAAGMVGDMKLRNAIIEEASTRPRKFRHDFQHVLQWVPETFHKLEYLEFPKKNITLSVQGGRQGTPGIWLPNPEVYTCYGVAIMVGGYNGPWWRPSDLGMEPELDRFWGGYADNEDSNSNSVRNRWMGWDTPAEVVQQIVNFLDPIDVKGFGAGR